MWKNGGFSVDNGKLQCLNNAAGWNDLAPGGVPELIIRFKATRRMLPGGLNVFFDAAPFFLTVIARVPIMPMPLSAA